MAWHQTTIWHTPHGDSYLHIDNNVPYFDDEDNYNDGIVKVIVSKRTPGAQFSCFSGGTLSSGASVTTLMLPFYADLIYSKGHAIFEQTALNSGIIIFFLVS